MRNALCHAPCAQRIVSRGGHARNALCAWRREGCAQRPVSPRGGRVHKALFGEGPAHNALCHPGGRVRNALCRATPCVTEGGRCTTLCVTGDACAQRLVSPGRGLCTPPCVMAGPVAQRVVSRGRVCAQRVVSWCDTTGWVCAQRVVSRGRAGGGPVRNALCHRVLGGFEPL